MAKRLLQCLLFAGLLAGTSSAANEAFIGKWKLNSSKSKLADQMTIAPAGENKYTLTLAGAGDTETIVADGTGQPGLFGGSTSITKVSPGEWKYVRKQDGKVAVTALWKLSADGKSLRDTFTSYQPDGSASQSVDTVYKRAEGSQSNSGIPGTWESTEEKVDSVYEVEFRPGEGEGLSTITAGGPAKNLKLDGKEYPGAAPGTASLSRRISDRSIETTTKLNNKVLTNTEISLSSDGKTLTMTVHMINQRPPNILVFDRE